MANITTNEEKYTCPECKNENLIPEGSDIGDVIECSFCGIEFEIIEITDNDEYVLALIEEEK